MTPEKEPLINLDPTRDSRSPSASRVPPTPIPVVDSLELDSDYETLNIISVYGNIFLA